MRTAEDLRPETRTTTGVGPATIKRTADGTVQITGLGAVFYDGSDGTEYNLFDNLFERLAVGAFDRGLRENEDVLSLFNHEPSNVLGRRSAGTLRLSVEPGGLRYTTTLADDDLSQRVATHVRRRDITGASIMFTVLDEAWSEEGKGKSKKFIREVRDVHLWEVGPVSFPAFDATTAEMDSFGAVRASFRSWRETGKPLSKSIARRDINARLLQIRRDLMDERMREIEKECGYASKA